ncbi:hypothetical protein NPIL_576171 [Nephila pilipes]|uniref:Uncharacterized protein n=1 Tax=Nephila pilipes TaxID=299642 RepID=A0A8X6NG65_NEPPI|nr:hypothetical protein NPIL_576171 [Nephila pilipes]
MDVKQCACLEKRPETYNRLAYIQESHRNQILFIYYIKKKAQAANDIGYPLQASTWKMCNVEYNRLCPKYPAYQKLFLRNSVKCNIKRDWRVPIPRKMLIF